MLTPTALLTDRGNGPEFIRVIPVIYGVDAEGTPTPNGTPGTPGPAIPAVVTRTDGKATEANGTTEASYAYRIMALTADDPGAQVGNFVMVENPLGSYTLVSATAARLRAPAVWTWDANEVEGF